MGPQKAADPGCQRWAGTMSPHNGERASESAGKSAFPQASTALPGPRRPSWNGCPLMPFMARSHVRQLRRYSWDRIPVSFPAGFPSVRAMSSKAAGVYRAGCGSTHGTWNFLTEDTSTCRSGSPTSRTRGVAGGRDPGENNLQRHGTEPGVPSWTANVGWSAPQPPTPHPSDE
jgi:hypothetical protein